MSTTSSLLTYVCPLSMTVVVSILLSWQRLMASEASFGKVSHAPFNDRHCHTLLLNIFSREFLKYIFPVEFPGNTFVE